MTTEQVPAEERTAHDYRNWTKPELCRLAAKLHNELLEAKRSLAREENARKIAVAEVDRLRIALNVACGENEG